MGVLKKRNEEEKNKKLTGRELFMTDKSLNESDLKFLEEGLFILKNKLKLKRKQISLVDLALTLKIFLQYKIIEDCWLDDCICLHLYNHYR